MDLLISFPDEVDNPVSPRQIAEGIADLQQKFGKDAFSWDCVGDPDDADDIDTALAHIQADRQVTQEIGS